MASLTVYAGTGDFGVISQNSDAATARSGGGALSLNPASNTNAGAATYYSGGTYTYTEAFLPFDTTALAGGAVTAADLILTAVGGPYTGRPLEARRLSSFPAESTAAFVPQASLGGLTLMGSANTGATTTTFALTAATVLESSSLPILVHHLWHRVSALGTPTGFEQNYNFHSANATGTTNDPRLEITYTPSNTAPTITSSSTVSVAENSTLSHSLTATDAESGVTWSIIGGADSSHFEISGSTLRWASNGTKDYENPTDSGTNNTYQVTVRATDTGSLTADQTITVTVTNVAENVSLTADAGSIVVTGQAATLALGRVLVAEAGAVVLTGQAAALAVGRSLTAEAGSFALTGGDVTFAIGGGNLEFAVDAGAFTITGGDASLSVGRVLIAEAGSFVLAGDAVGFTVTEAPISWTPVAPDSASWTDVEPDSALWSPVTPTPTTWN